MQASSAIWKMESPLKMGASAPIAMTQRSGIQSEENFLPKGTPSCAVPATAMAMIQMKKADSRASATRLKAAKICSMSSAACEPPRLCPNVSQPCPSRASRSCLEASVLRRISLVAGMSVAGMANTHKFGLV